MTNEKSVEKSIIKKFRLSPTDLEKIEQGMEKAQIKNFSEYVRSMAISGVIFHVNFNELLKSNHQLAKIGNNINQIAKKLNATGNFYATDFEILKQEFEALIKIKRTYDSLQLNLLEKKNDHY